MRRPIGAFKLAAGLAWMFPAADMLRNAGSLHSMKGNVIYTITFVAALLAVTGLFELATGQSVRELHDRFEKNPNQGPLIALLVLALVGGGALFVFLLQHRSGGAP